MENMDRDMDKDYCGLLRDVALLDKLKKEETGNYNRIVGKIRKRRNVHQLWRIAFSGAAIVLVALVLGNILRDEQAAVPPVAEVYESVESPVLITETGEQIALKNDESYTLDYVGQVAESADLRGNAVNGNKGREAVASNDKANKTATVSRNTVIIPNGYTYNIKFDDGTEAHINSGSYIEYPKSFSNRDKRVVSLTGEGYFKVAKSDKPFIVKANGLEVTVYGTEFNLNTNKENRVEVILVSGSVGVKGEGADNELLLEPNEMLVFNVNNGETCMHTINPEDYLGWMRGDFTCNNSSLFDLLDEISAFYGIEISKAQPMHDQLISISLSRQLGYKQLMEIMEPAFGIEFTHTEGMNYICRETE